MYIPLQNVRRSFTHVCDVFNGRVLLSDYCGSCCIRLKDAIRLANVIRKKCPEYRIYVEQYSFATELSIYHEIEFTTIEALHEQVLGVAHVVDVGVEIGKEMLGEDFER